MFIIIYIAICVSLDLYSIANRILLSFLWHIPNIFCNFLLSISPSICMPSFLYQLTFRFEQHLQYYIRMCLVQFILSAFVYRYDFLPFSSSIQVIIISLFFFGLQMQIAHMYLFSYASVYICVRKIPLRFLLLHFHIRMHAVTMCFDCILSTS